MQAAELPEAPELSQSIEPPEASEHSQASGSVYQPDPDDFDEDENEARRSKPEDVTLHLVHSFLQHALNLCLLQDSADSEVRLRVKRRRCTATVAKKFEFSAEDDGGICEVNKDSYGWKMKYSSLALLESKKEFKAVEDDKLTGARKPIVSNETLAQYLGEALAAWQTDQEVLDREYAPFYHVFFLETHIANTMLSSSVFVIAATSTFIRFIHFQFGSDYAKYIDAEDKRSQEALLDEHPKTFAYMNSTKWFNLETSEGRKSALCHTLALLRWHDARKGKSTRDSEVTNDSMSAEVDHNSDESTDVENDHTYSDDEYASSESIDMDASDN